MTDELAKTVMVEEVASPQAIAEALFVAVTRGLPLVQALADTGAVSADVLARYLARADVPFLRQVVPAAELVDALPDGLCARLLAVPVRRDPRTGTVDIVVADASDPHPPREIAFHLGAPVRVVRAHAAAIEEAIARHRARTFPPPGTTDRPPPTSDERLLEALPRPAPATSLLAPTRHDTPPWGTPFHGGVNSVVSEPPRSGLGSEIPIPLTRRTFSATRGGTQRPPPPAAEAAARSSAAVASVASMPASAGEYASFAPHITFADVGTVVTALREAGSRDEILELLLTGARTLAFRVAVFVAKRGDYVGWGCSPEFGDKRALQSLVVRAGQRTIFERAVHEGLYLGPVPYDDRHAALLGVMRAASRDVAVVPVRVSGRTAVFVVADELADTMSSTMRLEEIAQAAGQAFARILRTRK